MAVPKRDYAAIAAAKIHKPDPTSRRPRILVYARHKKGKTRLGSTAPDVLILDPESGTIAEKETNPDVWPITEWQDINDAYQFLRGGGASPLTGRPYRWVCIDGGTKVANIALRWCMAKSEERALDSKPGRVEQKHYGEAGEMFKGMLNNFHSLRGLGLVITCGERMIGGDVGDDADEDGEQPASLYVPDLPRGCRSAANGIVDIIGRLYTVPAPFERSFKKRETGEIVKKTIETGVQRRLWVNTHGQYETGARTAYTMPDYIPDPTIPKIVQAMRDGK